MEEDIKPIDPEVTLYEQVIRALKNVYDPEIPVNIFELGLIYEVNIDEMNDVRILMTLTSPACPAAQEIPGDIKSKVEPIPGVQAVQVEVTFDPPWDKDMMSDEAKLELGFM